MPESNTFELRHALIILSIRVVFISSGFCIQCVFQPCHCNARFKMITTRRTNTNCVKLVYQETFEPIMLPNSFEKSLAFFIARENGGKPAPDAAYCFGMKTCNHSQPDYSKVYWHFTKFAEHVKFSNT